MSSVEWYSGETPCSWKYSPSPIKNKSNKGWTKPSTAKPVKKEDIGPGKYTDGLVKAYRRTMSVSESHAFSKSKAVNAVHMRAKQLSYVPGVGAYKDVDKAFTNFAVIKKERTTVIFPYKAKGFTDDIVKRSKETPGPGSYYIGPPIKK